MLFLLTLKWNLQEKAFSCVKTNVAEMLKEAIIHFCLFDESHFSNICTFYYVEVECIKINFVNTGKRSEAAKFLFQYSYTELSKTQFSLSIVKTYKIDYFKYLKNGTWFYHEIWKFINGA